MRFQVHVDRRWDIPETKTEKEGGTLKQHQASIIQRSPDRQKHTHTHSSVMETHCSRVCVNILHQMLMNRCHIFPLKHTHTLLSSLDSTASSFQMRYRAKTHCDIHIHLQTPTPDHSHRRHLLRRSKTLTFHSCPFHSFRSRVA